MRPPVTRSSTSLCPVTLEEETQTRRQPRRFSNGAEYSKTSRASPANSGSPSLRHRSLAAPPTRVMAGQLPPRPSVRVGGRGRGHQPVVNSYHSGGAGGAQLRPGRAQPMTAGGFSAHGTRRKRQWRVVGGYLVTLMKVGAQPQVSSPSRERASVAMVSLPFCPDGCARRFRHGTVMSMR
jgi:hypothetical protein